MSELHDRIRGALLGGAIGDALGAPFEMLSSRRIEMLVGQPRTLDYRAGEGQSLLPGHPAGEPTDDTAMALSLARAVAAEDPITAESIAKAFLADLFSTGRFAAMFRSGAPGVATSRALHRLASGAKPKDNGYPEDGGNGAAMRAHPLGAIPSRYEVNRIAVLQARLTHGHAAAVAAAQAVALLTHELVQGSVLSPVAPAEIEDPIFLGAWRAAHSNLKLDARRLPAHLTDTQMSGWATVSAAHAIACLFEADPEQGIAAAAASGCDTDTIASICGVMLGARHGASALPRRWVNGLRARRQVEDAAEALILRYARGHCHV